MAAVSGSARCVRLAREWALLTAEASSIPGTVVRVVSDAEPQAWVVAVAADCPMLAGSLYAGEGFEFHIRLPGDFPARPPIVTFGAVVPEHAHIHSNGMICAEPLYAGWRVGASVRSLLLSILVMLAESKPHEKKRPSSDGWFSASYSRGYDPRAVSWVYHDDYASKAPVDAPAAAAAAGGGSGTPAGGGPAV